MSYLGRLVGTVNATVRTVKIAVFGPEDIKSAPEAGPFGIDSNPIPGMMAVYAKTAHAGQPAIVGYFIDITKPLPNQPIAQPGETRLYATDTSGTEKARIWMHNDGTLELGGTGAAGSNVNHATQWEALNTALDAYLNTPVTGLIAQIHSSISALGGAFPVVPGTLPTLDITPAKLTKIKTE